MLTDEELQTLVMLRNQLNTLKLELLEEIDNSKKQLDQPSRKDRCKLIHADVMAKVEKVFRKVNSLTAENKKLHEAHELHLAENKKLRDSLVEQSARAAEVTNESENDLQKYHMYMSDEFNWF